MTHAILFEAGLELENEEDAVNRIALVLHQVLKDNDFSWLREENKRLFLCPKHIEEQEYE